MTSIAVTGAAGAVGQRLVRMLESQPDVETLVAIDRVSLRGVSDQVQGRVLDLLNADLDGVFDGIDTIVHLAEHQSSREDGAMATAILGRVLEAATASGCPQLVLLSTAMVYGAHRDNPVPLTESEVVRPNPDLGFAVVKQQLEAQAGAWRAADPARLLAVLRPTVTLSERGVSWVAASLRAASIVRSDQLDPPVQFLHHDDLASAVGLVALNQLSGTFNVAPDGWIGPEAFRELVGGVQVRVPMGVSDQVLRVGRRFGIRPTPVGIEPYVRFPWVVANDALRSAGWAPSFSNEEAFVIGTPPPPWAVSAQRRQELALGAAGLGVAGAAAAATTLARRLSR